MTTSIVQKRYYVVASVKNNEVDLSVKPSEQLNESDRFVWFGDINECNEFVQNASNPEWSAMFLQVEAVREARRITVERLPE